jgi:Holliday junction resolvase RusA-like endonuclease
MKKKLQEYQTKYGHIPNDFYERFLYMVKDLKLSAKQVKELIIYIKKFLNKIEWSTIDFVFYFIPESTPRPRYSGLTRKFYVKNAKNDYDFFKTYVTENNLDSNLITTPCKFYCDIYIPIPNGMNKFEKLFSELKLIRPLSTPDWDNCGKKYSDMIQSELILNDSLIIDGYVRKFYSFKPRVEILIEYMNGYDCKFNKNKVEQWTSFKNDNRSSEKNHLLE